MGYTPTDWAMLENSAQSRGLRRCAQGRTYHAGGFDDLPPDHCDHRYRRTQV